MRRVKVIGAGIGGLTAAIGLQRQGFEVTVFERAPEPRDVGSGLSLWANSLAALDTIGIGDDVRALGTMPTGLTAGQRRPDGRLVLVSPPGATGELRIVHRADLHRLLSGALQKHTIRYGHSADASQGPFDVVIAADGLRSRTRASWPGDPGVRYSGYSTWRGVTSRPVDLRGTAGETLGRGERFGIGPLPDGRVYWFGVATMPADATFGDEAAEVRRRFARWHEPIADLIDATDPAAIHRDGIYDLAAPLRTFVRGRVALLGDAAHAMTPDLGQGAGQAIEDAATLSALLGSLDADTALHRYDTLRRARVQPIARDARRMGRLLQSRSPLRDWLLRLTPQRIMAAQLKRLQTYPAVAVAARQSGSHGVEQRVR